MTEPDDPFEARLARLTPTVARADPVAAAYAAGRRVGRRKVAAWRAVGVFGWAVAVVPATFRSSPPPGIGAAPVTTVVPLPPPSPLLPDSAVVLDRAVLDGGLPALPRRRRPNIDAFRIPADL